MKYIGCFEGNYSLFLLNFLFVCVLLKCWRLFIFFFSGLEIFKKVVFLLFFVKLKCGKFFLNYLFELRILRIIV